MSHDIGSRLKCLCASSHPCVVRLCDCLFSLFDPHFALFRVSLPSFHFILLNFDFYLFLFHVSSEQDPLCTSPIEESGPLANNASLTGYEPNFFDDLHTRMTRRSVTTPSPERSLHHCSLRSEKNQRAVDKLITLLKKVCCQVSRCLSVMSEQGDLFPTSLDHYFETSEKTQVATQKMSESGFSLNDNKEPVLADFRAQIQKHEFQADYDRRTIQKWNGVIESQRSEINRAHQGDERRRRDQQLTHEHLLKQNRDLREAHKKSLNEMGQLKRFQGSTLDGLSRRRLVEDRDTILELTGKIQELQDEVNCMNDSRDF